MEKEVHICHDDDDDDDMVLGIMGGSFERILWAQLLPFSCLKLIKQ